jgi:Adenylate and Guanylate cyclase catalytic domain
MSVSEWKRRLESAEGAWLTCILNFILARFVQDLVYPIVNEMDRVVVTGAEDYVAADHKVVGMLGASFYWRSLIRNILPKGSTGIQVVFHNPCSKSFTYQINGPNVEYLGVGDHHDPSYDSLGKSSRLDALEQFAIRGSAYSGAPIHSDFCPFSLHLYPSDVMKDAYTSYNSITFALAAVFIFAFTSVVFYLYDAKVESRQAKVMSTATRTSAIVSSLFPSGVRDRLYTDAVTGETGKNGDATKKKLQRFIKQGEVSTPTKDKGMPIADLYPETTVLFADIVGFTAWSSVRSPTQVFHLLESVYGAFDEIAKKRGVFKVETIGDSYVAVVGLPTARKHHAVVMARFASDCRDKMRHVTVDLEKSLGPVRTILFGYRLVRGHSDTHVQLCAQGNR